MREAADALWVERGAEQIDAAKKKYTAKDLDTRVMRSGSTQRKFILPENVSRKRPSETGESEDEFWRQQANVGPPLCAHKSTAPVWEPS